jgi:integrase
MERIKHMQRNDAATKTTANWNRIAFTDRKVKSLRANPDKKIVVWEQGNPGFGIRISPKGKKTWIAMTRTRVEVQGDTRPQAQVTLGHYPMMSLAEAHTAFTKAKDDARSGVDLRARKRSNGNGDLVTFADLCNLYLTQWLEPHRRASSVKAAKQLMQLPLARWANRPAKAITKADVIALHDEIASHRMRHYARFEGRGAVVQADHVLAIVRSAFRYGVGRDKVEKDPTEGIKKLSDNKPRDRVLSDGEIVALWQACDGIEAPFAGVFRMLLLTAQRKDEVAGMSWDEVDVSRKIWTIPATRAKNGKEHVVHLSDMALRILGKPGGGFVFSRDGQAPATYLFRAQKKLEDAMAARLGKRGHQGWTPHDLRRTAASGMAGLGVAPHVVDKILNHVSGTIRGVALIYNRHEYLEQRKDALEQWGAQLETMVGGKAKIRRPS